MPFLRNIISQKSVRSLVIYIILGAMLPSFGVVLLLEWHLFVRQVSETADLSTQTAHLAALRHQETQHHARTLLLTLATTIRYKGLAAPELPDLLSSVIHDNPSYAFLTLVRPDGRVVATSSGLASETSLATCEHFQNAMRQGSFVVGKATLSQQVQQPVLPMAMPILDATGSVSSVLLLGVHLNVYAQFFDCLRMPPETRFLLVDQNGTRLLRYPYRVESPVGTQMGARVWAIIQAAHASPFCFEATDPVGLPVTYTYIALNDSGLGILVGIPTPSLGTQLAPVMFKTLGAFVVITLIVFGVGLSLSNAFYVNGLVALERQATQITQARIPQPMRPITGGREIVALGEAINQMFRSLEEDRRGREQAELLTKEHATNFRNFFETMGDLVWVVTPQGRIMFTNSAVTATLGYTAEELQDMHLLDVHPPALRGEAEQIILAMFRGERDTCPLPLLTRNGSLVPVETRIWLGTWNGVQCVFGISKNLTAEQEARHLFERLFHNNPALMGLSTWPQRIFLDVNDTFLANTGYSRSDVVGHSARDLGLFHDPTTAQYVSEELHHKGRILNCELQMHCKDGSIRDGIFSGEVITSHDKTYLLTVVVDITARKQAEKMLRESEERLELALHGTNAGLWDWNVQSGVIVVNDRWLHMLGYTREELKPVSIATWERLCHPQDLELSDRRVEQHFAGELDSYSCDVRIQHKDGHWIWVRDRGRCVERDAEGRPLRMVGTHVDITARKHDEELRDEIERIVRHDLRSPAGSAINVARMLADSPSLSEEDRQLAILLERSGQEMLDTLNMSLDLYRIESGKYEFVAQELALDEVLEEALAPLRMAAQHRSRRVEQELGPVAPRVLGTSFLLRMALRNLLQNALEATPRSGTVYIEVRAGDPCTVEIANPGVVPLGIRERFFEKYVTHGKTSGTGLGTYSARLMIEAQGGTVEMSTSDTAGRTVVTVTLPSPIDKKA